LKSFRFLLVLAVLASSTSLHAANLLNNGGFNADLSQWAGGGESTLPTAWDRADASGSQTSGSARLTWTGPSLGGMTAGGLVQNVKILQGGAYQFSARARVTSQPSANALVLLIWKRNDGSAIVTVGMPLSLTNNAFAQAQMSVQAPTDASSALVILTIPRQSGLSILFDDIVLDGQGGLAPPQVLGFNSNPPSIRPGETSRLSFGTANATTITIDNGIGTQPFRGTVDVAPTVTTTYKLTATGPGGSVTAKTIVNVLSAPKIVSSKSPPPMLEFPGSPGATTSFILSNVGGADAKIDLGQDGDFFMQSPTSFTIPAGGSQTVSIMAKQLPAGEYKGASIVGMDGRKLFDVRVPLLSVPPPNGAAMASPQVNRVDVTSKSGATPSGTVTFNNPSGFPVAGVISSDVAWITTQQNIAVIPPGGSVSIPFTVDRSLRPDGTSPSGSASGTISLSYFNGPAAAGKATELHGSSTSLAGIVIVDTVTPDSSSSTVPALATDEIGLLIAGVGHVTGSGGKEFVSDVSIANPLTSSVDDMKLYYTSSTTSAANSQALVASQSLALADVVTSYFGLQSQVGTLHVRSTNTAKLSVNANVFNKSNTAGTYGTALPTLRTDRAISAGQTLNLSGLRKDSSAHTNIYLQEMAGGAASADITFLDATGSTVSTITGKALTAWGLVSINDAAPAGAVRAVVSDTSGKVSAFATPVDDASGDTWAVADWDRQNALTGNEPMLIPVVGAAAGANNTNFKSDVTMTNFGTASSTLTLFYTGNAATKTVTLGTGETKVFNNIVPGFFEVNGTSVGALFATPATDSNILITSRTYTASDGSAATYGTGVPTMPLSGAISLGDSRVFGGIEDSTVSTVSSKQGGTFRSNFGLVETSGKSVTISVSVSFADGTQLVAGGVNGSATYTLAANEYKQLNGIVQSVMGDARSNYGDLHNVAVTFSIVSGSGSVIPFITSTDNGTGDTVLRTE